MITPTEIHQKAEKLWQSGRVLKAVLTQEPLFPWSITFRKPTAMQQVENFAAIRDWICVLHAQSKTGEAGQGYCIDYKTVNHRQLGTQQLPATIVFESQDDLLRYLGKIREWELLLSTAQQTITRFPALEIWLVNKPQLLMKSLLIWQQLLAVCDYFVAHPRPDCYLRELDIVAVDSKFIEQNSKLLAELLDSVLVDEAIDSSITHLRQHGFERRYGLKFEQPVVRLRVLDQALYPVANVNDMSLPLTQLAAWSIPCSRVFITENKTNGLSFPAMQESVVIFGLGYGVDSLAQIPWLAERELFYWGDIDTHGFGILARLRHYFPQVKSVMMDVASLGLYADLCVLEPEKAQCQSVLTGLNDAEQVLYQQLQESHQRLEQERLPMGYVKEQLLRCCEKL